MPTVKFGYWKLRGLGQSIRLLMEYTGTDYEEKMYEFGPAPTFDATQWTNEKFNLGMDFPNLPYYCDGKYKITQSHAILKHLGRKHNMVGETECESVRVDMVEHEALDWRTAFIKLAYSPKDVYEDSKEAYKTVALKNKLESLSNYLGNNKWFAGDKLTYVDFLVYELLDINKTIFGCCLDNHCSLKRYMERFEAMDRIKKYMSSDRFLKAPLNGPMAAVGHS